MTLQTTDIFAEADDLALIKQRADRLGIPEAEIIRRGIHIAAMSVRKWDTPLRRQRHVQPGWTTDYIRRST